jgi:hypothetical protein
MTFILIPAMVEAFVQGATLAISVYLYMKEQEEKSK